MTLKKELHSKPHIVIIGAGIVGSAIAFHLTRRGANVTVVDAQEPGQGASKVSFAWINAHSKTPRHYHELNRRSLDMWDRFARRLGGEIGLTWGGELRWTASAAGAEQLMQHVTQLQSWGYPIRPVDREEMQQMEPAIETGPVSAATYTDIEGHVDASKVIERCLAHANAWGAELRWQSRVEGFTRSQPEGDGRSCISSVTTSTGEIPSDVVVLAGGADTPQLASTLGIEIPLDHSFGATLITEAMEPLFRQVAVIHTPRDSDIPLNIRQLPNGALMIHGGSHGGMDDRSMGKTDAEVQQVMQAATRFLPRLAGVKIVEERKGRRPLPRDGHPILGFTPSLPNLYVAATHSGVTLAPLVGECAAIEILDDIRIELLEPYRLARFHSN